MSPNSVDPDRLDICLLNFARHQKRDLLTKMLFI